MHALTDGATDRIEQKFTRLRHTAADNNTTRSDRGAHIGCCNADVKPRFFINVFSDLIACFGGFGN